MFSSRNIHFAILGVILGAASGYIFAFYQVQRSAPVEQTSGRASGANVGQSHPEVTNDQMLALFREAMARNPNEPELMMRYANFLGDLNRFQEAVEWYRKVLAMEPGNLNVRNDMASTLWNMGDPMAAIAEYESAYKIDPNHVPTIHNLAAAHIDGDGDLQKAAELVKRLEEIDPKYAALPSLEVKLQDRQRQSKKAQ